MIPVTCGYARVSKTSDATRNLETYLHILQEYGIREEHIFADETTGSSTSRPAWNELMTRVRSKDSAVIALRGRSTGNFDEGVKIQADLTKQDISIVAVRLTAGIYSE
jgi:DNA invertase Pin-like site-specific DNA recombinase